MSAYPYGVVVAYKWRLELLRFSNKPPTLSYSISPRLEPTTFWFKTENDENIFVSHCFLSNIEYLDRIYDGDAGSTSPM